MVYVLNVNGVPLMPTDRHGKVRRLLKSKRARVVKRTPFTIQLLYDTPTYVQPLTLGVDAGSKHIGLSVSSENKEVYAGQIEPRQDVSKKLDERRQYRRSRRNRLRYRKPRFNNRTASKPKGWIAPSIACKIESHVAVIGRLHQILPITEIIVEVADFARKRYLTRISRVKNIRQARCPTVICGNIHLPEMAIPASGVKANQKIRFCMSTTGIIGVEIIQINRPA